MQVENPQQAVRDLEATLGFEVQGYAEGTVAVPERLRIDKKKLKSFLNWVLKLHAKGDGKYFSYFLFPLRSFVSFFFYILMNALPIVFLCFLSAEMPTVRCFEHGQSNPTYFVRYANKNMVLRKKPVCN